MKYEYIFLLCGSIEELGVRYEERFNLILKNKQTFLEAGIF